MSFGASPETFQLSVAIQRKPWNAHTYMNTNARSRLLDTGRVLSFRFSQPSVRAGSPCDRSLSHSRGGYFVANETPSPRAGCPVRDNPPTWVESQSGRS